MTDLWLFALALGKVGLLCGFVPGILFYEVVLLVRALGWVPSPYTSGEKVVRVGNVEGESVEDFFSARPGYAENTLREVAVGSSRAVA